MSKKVRNIPASIKERLKNISVESGKDFNQILRQYIQERFLYRLSKSSYSENFILKGALLFLAYDLSRTRPTRDIDLLGSKISNNAADIKKIMKIVSALDCEDGLKFDSNKIEVSNIAEDGDYHGIRVKMNAKIGTIKERIQIDIGFGDKITIGQKEIDYPTLLDLPSPKLKVYSLETAIAEKFEAIVSLQLQTSRMKDFYDIYFIASKNNFNLDRLKKAIVATFKNRATNISYSNTIFSDTFKNDENKNILWNAFTKRNKLIVDKTFPEILDFLNIFFQPILDNVSSVKSWDPVNIKWQ